MSRYMLRSTRCEKFRIQFESFGVGVAIGIGIEKADSDSNPDPECMSIEMKDGTDGI
jgi:hypothetical protein